MKKMYIKRLLIISVPRNKQLLKMQLHIFDLQGPKINFIFA